MQKKLKKRLCSGVLSILTIISITGSSFADSTQVGTSDLENSNTRSSYNSYIDMEGHSTLTGSGRSYTKGTHKMVAKVTRTDEAMPTKFKAYLQKSSLGTYKTVDSNTYEMSTGMTRTKYFGSQTSGTYRYKFSNRNDIVGSTYSQGFRANVTMSS